MTNPNRPAGGLDDLPEKLRTRIQEAGGHWLWVGSINHSGYGQISSVKGQSRVLAHRAVWLALGGELPEHLHHECPHKNCVRPACLSPLTNAEHQILHHAEAPRTHCKNGHEFTEANTGTRRTRNGRTARRCLRCSADVSLARRHAMSPEQRRAWDKANNDRRRNRSDPE